MLSKSSCMLDNTNHLGIYDHMASKQVSAQPGIHCTVSPQDVFN